MTHLKEWSAFYRTWIHGNPAQAETATRKERQMEKRVLIEQSKVETDERIYDLALGFVLHGWQVILTGKGEKPCPSAV